MNSRNKILAAVTKSKPAATTLPDIKPFNEVRYENPVAQYEAVINAIGGEVFIVDSWDEIKAIISEKYDLQKARILSLVPELNEVATSVYEVNPAAHQLADVEVSLINAHFGVAENGAVWVTEDLLGHRAVPFICQHLAAVITSSNIVATMHQAYMRIGNAEYGWGAFIAGPSKTADIEQSLVLGAHGPRSMTVFILTTS